MTGLVLEGGGVRGIYTAGVLDFLMEQNLHVDNVIGVSAGAIHGVNYVSNQIGRSLRVSTNYVDDKRYLSIHSWLRTGDIFGAKFCYDTIPNELDLYDYDTFSKNSAKLYATVSNVETGEAEYLCCNDLRKDIVYVRASASLPIVSRIVEIHGKKYLDGGICDSIPLKQSQSMGNDKHIVILTRIEGYIKKPNRTYSIIRRMYRAYPAFVKAAQQRHVMYNEQIKYILEEEKKGNCFVIRPSSLIEVGRLEKDRNKIKKLYQLGYSDMQKQYHQLLEYLEK